MNMYIILARFMAAIDLSTCLLHMSGLICSFGNTWWLIKNVQLQIVMHCTRNKKCTSMCNIPFYS